MKNTIKRSVILILPMFSLRLTHFAFPLPIQKPVKSIDWFLYDPKGCKNHETQWTIPIPIYRLKLKG